MSTVASSVIEAQHDIDPKKVINDALKGWLDRITPTSGDIVVCVYERPEKIKGSSLLIPETASRRVEDRFQGVVGLIVKVGPEYAKHRQELGLEAMPPVGTWVAFRTQDCQSFTLGARAMRLLQGNHIRLTLADPDCIL